MALPLRDQDVVALNGRDSETHELDRLRAEVARLREQLEAERASVSALNAQLTVMARQLDAAQLESGRRALRRRRG